MTSVPLLAATCLVTLLAPVATPRSTTHVGAVIAHAAGVAAPFATPIADAPRVALRLVDLTGDGLPDKLHLASDGALAVSVNLGRGGFALVSQALPRVAVSDVLATDLDGDGHTDLYLVSPGANVALRGDGTGRLVDATDVLGLADEGLGLSAERVDMDGVAPDELVLHDAAGDVLFWARDGVFVRDADSTPATWAATGGVASDGAASPGTGGAPGIAAATFAAPPGVASGLTVGGTPGTTTGGGRALSTGDLAVLQQILPHLSVVQAPDGQGGTNKTVRFTGVNVQIVNGMGATNGNPAMPYLVNETVTGSNGLGNLIVGYDEPRLFGGFDRTGSHNLVVGKEQTYSSYGGLVAGDANRVTAPYCSAAGGYDGTVSGLRSAILGGHENKTFGEGAAVVGGGYNEVAGHLGTAGGGAYNLVPGDYAQVCGGEMNRATGITSCVAGGVDVEAAGVSSTAVGGYGGTADNYASTVLGGENGTADGFYSTVVGGSENRAGPDGLGGTGDWAVVLGGRFNHAAGEASTVAGGGGYLPTDGNTASGLHSAVSGGRSNTASGSSATVGGGLSRGASGDDDWAAGSLLEDG